MLGVKRDIESVLTWTELVELRSHMSVAWVLEQVVRDNTRVFAGALKAGWDSRSRARAGSSLEREVERFRRFHGALSEVYSANVSSDRDLSSAFPALSGHREVFPVINVQLNNPNIGRIEMGNHHIKVGGSANINIDSLSTP